MKFHWETKDVVCGRIVCKPNTEPAFEPNGWTAKWTYKIGWQCGLQAPPAYKGEDSRYHTDHFCTVAMTDGMTGPCQSKAEITKWLNGNGMIPMPHDWFIKTMEFLKDCYEVGDEG